MWGMWGAVRWRGGVWWSVVECGGVWWSVVECGGVWSAVGRVRLLSLGFGVSAVRFRVEGLVCSLFVVGFRL